MDKNSKLLKKWDTLSHKGGKEGSPFSRILLVLKLYSLRRRLTEKRRRLTRQLWDMLSNHRSVMRAKWKDHRSRLAEQCNDALGRITNLKNKLLKVLVPTDEDQMRKVRDALQNLSKFLSNLLRYIDIISFCMGVTLSLCTNKYINLGCDSLPVTFNLIWLVNGWEVTAILGLICMMLEFIVLCIDYKLEKGKN